MVSGIFMYSYDPQSLYLQNIYIDIWAAEHIFFMDTTWNYAEAYLAGYVYADSIIVDETKERTIEVTTNVLIYKGPGNITFTNIDMRSKYFGM